MVVPATLSDVAASLGIAMIKKLDNELNLKDRCIGVITKSDRELS